MAFFNRTIAHTQVNNNDVDTVNIQINSLAGYDAAKVLIIRSVYASNATDANTTVKLNYVPATTTISLFSVNDPTGTTLLLNNFDNPLILSPVGRLQVLTIAPTGNVINIKIDYQFVQQNILAGSTTYGGLISPTGAGNITLLASQTNSYLVKNLSILSGPVPVEIYITNPTKFLTVAKFISPTTTDPEKTISFFLPAGYSIGANIISPSPPPISFYINLRITN